ncbi:MAG: acyl-CoA dehydrogenase family protein [Bacillota bacterium]
MSYQLSDELKALQATVKNFVKKEIIPREAELDFDAPLLKPEQLKEVQEKARSAGLWLLNLPEEYGGGGLSLFAQCIVAEEASQHRLGAYNPCGGAFGFDVPHILCKGNIDQINRFLLPT